MLRVPVVVLGLIMVFAANVDAQDYDFTTNVPLAHVYRDGVVADAASPGFVKYQRAIRRNWTVAREDGRPCAYVPGLQGNLWFPVDGELASANLALEAALKPFGRGQRADVFVNGKKIASLELAPGWGTHRLQIPAGVVKRGYAKVRLHFRRTVMHAGEKTAAAVRYVRLTKASAAPAPVGEASVARALSATRGDGLFLPHGGGLDYYLVPPKGMTLVGQTQGGAVEVWVGRDGKKPKKLAEGSALHIPLKSLGGQAIRLMFRGKGGDVTLTGAKLVARAKTAVPKAAAPKYVVFWLIDTLRADKLDFYDVPNANRRKKVATPRLAAVAKEGTVFEPFWVQGNESKASHASLFTGTYPVKHRVFTHKAKLADAHTTLAEAFAKAGYTTAGFVSNGYISDKWNFTQGFNRRHYANFIREGKANNAKAVTNAAIRWIDKHQKESFYLYLGTADPHVTYRAHKGLIEKYDRGPAYTGRYVKNVTGTELGKIKGKKRPPSARDRQRIEALYENEIAFNDHHFGRLVDHLKTLGIYHQTMIIISADHGDEFWEHGSCGHGHSLHQELINVPLLIRMPGLFPAGKRVTAGAEGVDLLPTVQSILGQKFAKDNQGHDVRPLAWTTGLVYPWAIIASQGVRRYALQVGRAKVIMRSERAIKVYDMLLDPAEATDLFGQSLVLSAAALDPLSLFLSRAKRWKKAEMGPPNNLIAPLH